VARSRTVARGSIGPPRRGRVVLAGAIVLLTSAGLLGLASAGGVAGGVWEGVLYLLPALLLAVVLLLRRYPGERLLRALVARRAHRARIGARRLVMRGIELPVPQGGRLIAVSLAGRAPPLARAGARC
jgi:hypothetical protein